MSKPKQRLREAINDSWQRHQQERRDADRQSEAQLQAEFAELEKQLEGEFAECLNEYETFALEEMIDLGLFRKCEGRA